MSVLVFIEISKGKVKKSSLEAASYAAKVAAATGGQAIGLAVGQVDNAELAQVGAYGVAKVLHVTGDQFAGYDPQVLAKAVIEAANANGAKVIVFSHDTTGKGVAPRVAARLKAGLVAGAIDYPKTDGGKFTVKKAVFSGKAFAEVAINTDVKVISLTPNSVGVTLGSGSAAVEAFAPAVEASKLSIENITKAASADEIPLPEAELVVSAGRGMKGPENWGMIEDLAHALGAATACSRPVADIGWRPHHEHVGQTGVTVRPNLYIAIGISGAIQHLAGVNGSKVMVVINKDPEAPFFKAADYGIVGDAFEIVPRLTEAVKKLKASQN